MPSDSSASPRPASAGAPPGRAPGGPVQSGHRLMLLLLKPALALLALATLGRLALLAWQWPRLHDLPLDQRLLALLHGLRMDLILVSLLLLLPAVLLTLAPRVGGALTARLVRAWALVALSLGDAARIASRPRRWLRHRCFFNHLAAVSNAQDRQGPGRLRHKASHHR